MHRRAFISDLGLSVAAVCSACLAACSKSGTVEPPSNVNFTIDLTTDLLTVGSSKVQSGVIVVRLSAANDAASFTAVQVACTHEGTPLNYNAAQTKFICPLHGSEFNTGGAVLLGPAGSNLKKFTVTVNNNTLTVTG